MKEEIKYQKIAGCVMASCPAIYEQVAGCAMVTCPSAYKSETEDYLIVGRSVSEEHLRESGLAGRVGDGESAIIVPKSLIEELIQKK